MKNILAVVLASLLALSSVAWGGPVEEGTAAYERKDFATALVWFRKAADQGQAIAQLILGAMYAEGEGVPKDDQQALYWYRKAADQGQAEAQFNLGLMYANGQGVPKDDQQAQVPSLAI